MNRELISIYFKKINDKKDIFNAIMTAKHIGRSIISLGICNGLRGSSLNARKIKKIDLKTVYLISSYCSNLRYIGLG